MSKAKPITNECIKVYMDIACNVQSLRRQKNMTQSALAEAAHASISRINLVESLFVIKPVSLELLVSIATALGQPVEQLFKPAVNEEVFKNYVERLEKDKLKHNTTT